MRYRRDIDGIRALAVIPVVLFHAGFNLFSGGYVGVDVFFVISGYLITSILLNDIEKGPISFAAFYERRIRRILPALLTVVCACVPFALLWMPPTQVRDFAQSVIAALLMFSNIHFWSEDHYFALASELKPLLHTWSLAVEEQFYLFFPWVLIVAWRFGKRGAFICVAALATLSFAFSEWGWRNVPSANFYLASSRAWELLVGSLCACATFGRSPRSNNPASFIGLALIVYALCAFDDNTPYPSFYTLVPVAGTAILILYADQTPIGRLLSKPYLVGIGLISYSAYLWHQPLFALARLRSPIDPGHGVMVVLSIATFLLAWASWRFVEQPFRKQGGVFRTRRSMFAAGGVATAVVVVLAALVANTQLRHWDIGGKMGLAALEERIAVNYGLGADCEGQSEFSPTCRTTEQPNVLLWGDSFAMHLVQGLIASDSDVALQQHTLSSCAPIAGIAQIDADRTENWARACIDFNNRALDWLRVNDQIDLVILSSQFDAILDSRVLLQDGRVMKNTETSDIAQQLGQTAEAIRQTGARVVVVSPTPRSSFDVGQCTIKATYFGYPGDVCDFESAVPPRTADFLEMAREIVPIYQLADDICYAGACTARRDGIFIYRDGGHLSKEGSAYLGRENAWMSELRELAD